MNQVIIPNKKYFDSVYKIIKRVCDTNQEPYNSFYHIFYKLFYKTPELDNLVSKQTKLEKFKISDGTSDYTTFKPFLKQVINDFKTNKYYRNYNSSLGNVEARQSLAYMENSKFDQIVYSYLDFALTEGSTGAISQVFEFIKQNFPQSNTIIATPAYYIYKYAAKYYKQDYIEALSVENTSDKTTYFNPIPIIISNINSKTKLIVITQPANPTSQIFPENDIKKLLKICKENNIYLLTDELFSDLIYSSRQFVQTDKIACKVNALDQLIIIKGYSKSKNLAALRIGYLFSKNKFLLEELSKISEQRQCFTSSTCFTGLIALDSFIQTIKQYDKEGRKINFKIIKSDFNKISNTISSYPLKRLLKIFNEYQKYSYKLKKYYSRYCDDAIKVLKNDIQSTTSKEIAFNTLIKIKGLEKVNYFDFCLNFYLCCNVVTQIGPCFAFDQIRWETDPSLGFWMRISYSKKNKKQFMESLQLFKEFKRLFLKNPKKFLVTNLSF